MLSSLDSEPSWNSEEKNYSRRWIGELPRSGLSHRPGSSSTILQYPGGGVRALDEWLRGTEVMGATPSQGTL